MRRLIYTPYEELIRHELSGIRRKCKGIDAEA
jgi:hypothetical protein